VDILAKAKKSALISSFSIGKTGIIHREYQPKPAQPLSLILEKRGKIRVIVAERGIMAAKPHEKTEIIAISSWI
jgi:hypothetical protein